jgi:L-iditol 2-dehydrogenase
MHALTKTKPGPGFVELAEHHPATPSAGEVRLRVLATGICGTDLHIEAGEYPADAPVIMGHEVVGEIDLLGQGVADEWLGRRVACETFYFVCQECRWCRAGQPNLCPRRRSIGSHVDGGFAPTLVLPARSLHVVPVFMSAATGTLLEPLACVCNAMLNPGYIAPGDQVLVTGPGTIGLLAAQVARLQGAAVTVTGLATDAQRLEVARTLGLETATGAPPDNDYDVTIESSGSQQALGACLQRVRRRGHHVQLGIFGRDITAGMDAILYKELTVTSGFASTPSSWQRACVLAASGAVSLEPLVSDIVPIAEWQRAFAAARNGEGLKYVIDPR